ncbi:hypothetical protein VNO77_34079 [Canavalia gladiata]|uniref:Uncharacterized protein n=1 Tax=Canavalia gladiata TaxID=3824 RepID=A0AAN9Q1F8_CANGL
MPRAEDFSHHSKSRLEVQGRQHCGASQKPIELKIGEGKCNQGRAYSRCMNTGLLGLDSVEKRLAHLERVDHLILRPLVMILSNPKAYYVFICDKRLFHIPNHEMPLCDPLPLCICSSHLEKNFVILAWRVAVSSLLAILEPDADVSPMRLRELHVEYGVASEIKPDLCLSKGEQCAYNTNHTVVCSFCFIVKIPRTH